jgi:hypothetical protein
MVFRGQRPTIRCQILSSSLDAFSASKKFFVIEVKGHLAIRISCEDPWRPVEQTRDDLVQVEACGEGPASVLGKKHWQTWGAFGLTMHIECGDI